MGFPNTTDQERITRTFRFERGNDQWQVNGQLVGGCNQAPRFRIKRNSVGKWIFQNNSGGWQRRPPRPDQSEANLPGPSPAVPLEKSWGHIKWVKALSAWRLKASSFLSQTFSARA